MQWRIAIFFKKLGTDILCMTAAQTMRVCIIQFQYAWEGRVCGVWRCFKMIKVQ